MSSHRRALALAVLSLSGCFSDEGANLTQPAVTLGPGSTSTAGSTASTTNATTDPVEVTTDAPGPTTTAGPESTSDPTTSDDTTAAPVCPGVVECTPGDGMVTTLLCDPCGRIRRTCQPDCTWGPDECGEDLSSCAFWYYDDAWTRVALPQPPPVHAPTGPVIAAFELSEHGRLFALTADRYHVMEAFDQSWIASGPLASLFPDLPGPVLQAYAIYNDDGTYTVTLVGDPTAWLYVLPAAGYQATLADTGPCCNSWTDLVKPGSLAEVRDIFIDLTPPYPWTTVDFYAPCIKQTIPLERYAAWVTPTDVFVQDVGYCFELVYVRPHAQFTPLAAPGAPPGHLIGGTAMLGQRLYVFAGE